MTARRTTAIAAAALATTLVGGLVGTNPQPAQAAPTAPAHWFGDFVMDEYLGSAVNPSTSTTLTIEHPSRKFALPFHTYATASLYDCTGAAVWSTYGSHFNRKAPGKKWDNSFTVNLDVPDVTAEYDRFEVTVHSKGRAPVTKTLREAKNFTLGCDGGTTISSELYSHRGKVTKPANAHFDRSPEQALKSYARFGTVVGEARVGSTVRIKGVKVVGKRPGTTNNCSTYYEITHAKNRSLVAADPMKCTGKLKLTRTAEFFAPRGKVRRSVEGGTLIMSSIVFTGGHHYARDFRIGKIKAKK